MGTLFSEEKVTQAAGLFLKLAGGELNYMVLLKDLYLSDREALSKWARTITNDDYFSMKCGPVLSRVKELIDDMPSPEEANYWAKHISPPSNFMVKLLQDPGTAKLSESEEDLIGAVFEKYRYYQTRPFPFVDYLHSILSEWEQLTEGRSPITLHAILAATNKSEEEIKQIESEINYFASVQSLFGVNR